MYTNFLDVSSAASMLVTIGFSPPRCVCAVVVAVILLPAGWARLPVGRAEVDWRRRGPRCAFTAGNAPEGSTVNFTSGYVSEFETMLREIPEGTALVCHCRFARGAGSGFVLPADSWEAQHQMDILVSFDQSLAK